MAESAVKIIKHIFKTCQDSGSDVCLALLQQRNALKSEMFSPSQLLFSRRLRSTLPIASSLLKPSLDGHVEYKRNSFQKQSVRNC